MLLLFSPWWKWITASLMIQNFQETSSNHWTSDGFSWGDSAGRKKTQYKQETETVLSLSASSSSHGCAPVMIVNADVFLVKQHELSATPEEWMMRVSVLVSLTARCDSFRGGQSVTVPVLQPLITTLFLPRRFWTTTQRDKRLLLAARHSAVWLTEDGGGGTDSTFLKNFLK